MNPDSCRPEMDSRVCSALGPKHPGIADTQMLRVIHRLKVWLTQTENWIFNQIKYLSGDIECHVLCERTRNLDKFDFPRINTFYQGKSAFSCYWARAISILGVNPYTGFFLSSAKNARAEILHSHFGNVGWEDINLAKLAGTRHLVTFYGLDVNYLPTHKPIWRKRYQALFSSCDIVLCEGSHMASCIELLGCPSNKLKVQHLGIEVEAIPFRPRCYSYPEPLKVLIAARFTEKKGIPYAIEALGKIQKDFPVLLTIIGDAERCYEGQAEKRKIMLALERANLIGKANLLGYQPYNRLLFEAYKHHLFLSPSVTAKSGDTEGGAPISIIEMLASGMPVVSTLHCDIPEVLNYGEGDWLAQERDVDGLVKIIQKWMENPSNWLRLLTHARKHIEKEYSAVEQGKKLSNLYKLLCS
jgi:colanic acid/amylovoran biosynthesis glycosyltransferase